MKYYQYEFGSRKLSKLDKGCTEAMRAKFDALFPSVKAMWEEAKAAYENKVEEDENDSCHQYIIPLCV